MNVFSYGGLLAACLLGLSLCLSPVAAQDTAPLSPLNPVHVRIYETDSTRYPDIRVYFSVLNRQNGRVLPITQDNLRADLRPASSPAVPAAIQQLDSQPNTARRLNLVLCFDLTASNTGDFLEQQKKTAFDLIDNLDVNDSVAIVTQSGKGSDVVFPLQPDHGGARNAIDDLTIVKGQGNTFYDGVSVAVNALNGVKDPTARSAVIVMTDVQEPGGSALPEQTIQLANTLNTPLYMIGYHSANADVLNGFANATNGYTYLQRGDENFERMTHDITAFLNQEYVLTLTASLPAQETKYQLDLAVDIDGESFQANEQEIVGTSRTLQVTFPLIEPGQTFTDEIRFEPQMTYADGSRPSGIQVTYTLERSPVGKSSTQLSTGDTQNPILIWDLRGKPGGDYSVRLSVVDAYGNTGEQTVSFVVASPLTVDFVDPDAPDTLLSKGLYIAQPDNRVLLRIDGSYGLSQVVLRLNGQDLGLPSPVSPASTAEVETASPLLYEYLWDTSALAPGAYTLSAEAQDTRGNAAGRTLDVEILLSHEDPFNILIFAVIIVVLVIVLVALTLVRRATQRPRQTPIPMPVMTAPMPAAGLTPIGTPPPAALRPRATLVVVANGLPGHKEHLLMERNYIVGRGDTVDIQVVGLSASRTHAELHWDGGQFVWIELTPEKKNPAFINGRPVVRRQPLLDGDQIQLGETVFQFRMSPS